MKHLLTAILTLASLMLGGCASTLHNNVATFHEWPADLAKGSTFAFDAPPAKANGIEYTQYQKILAAELVRLGMVEAANSGQPADLKVSMDYSIKPIETRYVIDPFFGSNSAAYRYPVRFPTWYSHAYCSRFGSRFSTYPGCYFRYYGRAYYDPFWFYASQPEEDTSLRFQRELKIGITRAADGKKLYEVTVDNATRRREQSVIVPHMIQSAFVNFPGKSGEHIEVDVPLKD